MSRSLHVSQGKHLRDLKPPHGWRIADQYDAKLDIEQIKDMYFPQEVSRNYDRLTSDSNVVQVTFKRKQWVRTSPGSAIRNLKVVTSKHKMMNYGPAKLMKQQFIQDDGTIKDSLTSHEEVKYVLLVKYLHCDALFKQLSVGLSGISGTHGTSDLSYTGMKPA